MTKTLSCVYIVLQVQACVANTAYYAVWNRNVTIMLYKCMRRTHLEWILCNLKLGHIWTSSIIIACKCFNSRRHRPFCVLRRHKRGAPPSRLARNWARASQKKQQHSVGRHETKPTVPGFKVIGQLVTPEVRSMTQKWGKWGSDKTA